MQPDDIAELLRLRGWSKTKLASELDVTEAAVHSWMLGRRKVGGPASILMRMWLAESKATPRKKRAVSSVG